MVWSPLARGLLARPWDAAGTARSGSDPFAGMLYTSLTTGADRAITDAVGAIAADRGVPRAQVALAWLRRNPVVAAPLVGASSMAQVDDAVASLDLDLTDDEAAALQRPYTPRYDFQGVSDEAELDRIRALIPGMTT
jgi:aryl-alcohol dehydrogenase-like predicted oxidoreductase